MTHLASNFSTMISYNENDGYLYATQLKQAFELAQLKVSFMDKKTNTNEDDQAEYLNKSIDSCAFFVAIVTPEYGSSTMSNRELKAAFTRKIPIMPIKFIESWPPRCFAIQLSTVQFLYSKPPFSTLPIGDLWQHEDVLQVTNSLKTEFNRLQMLKTVESHLVKTPPTPFKIFISYVNSESRKLALALKLKLVELGQNSIYLDQEQITPGCDWNDSLNYGLYSCKFFIPLVSNGYGNTEWTKLEAHLAHHLSKTTFPISFLKQKDWPPTALAIQYSGLEYIPWPDLANLHESINQVAPELTKRIVRAEKEMSEKEKKAASSSK